MKKEVRLDDENISYTLKKSSKSKNIKLYINSDNSIIVTAPNWLPVFFIEIFLKKKSKWILEKVRSLKETKEINKSIFNDAHYKKHKEEALNLVIDRAEYFSQMYNLKYNKISVKNQKTRWGSCSATKNLNFNYKILFLPERLRDYIVVHEICHLKEFNHSAKFWDLVSEVFPDHLTLRKELRKKGLNLK